ncbi:thioredoxin domain-containing protein [Psychroserpens ponticola]|uniref:Uncharacterized protein n=1 Tax=Psychroserpens ponticola TaxID=2932268 RepID=A0ABY7RUL3_9FLAO|nr:hypothetical protein [Psychroserpens ponticola]WCO00818.1 hypothetical protein MUN68_012165 [Psychroserpens ponticola]
MKKHILICLFVFGSLLVCQSQEWMTSLEAAKSLAYVQDKLLFVVWEDVTFQEYPVLMKNEQGVAVIDDLFSNESINEVIWEHFVPVIIGEQHYEELFNQIKGKRSQLYIDKFNDDTIKIMDVNGNIINAEIANYGYLDIAKFITKYAINTSFLKAEITNYRAQKEFNTAYRLASKYVDFSVLVNGNVRPEIVKLSNFYLKEAESYVTKDTSGLLKQKIELQKLKQPLVLGKAKKVLRQLKRIDVSELDSSNESLIAFLYFTSYILLKDENNASVWRSKVSLVNLKKANLIVKNNF